VIEVIVDEAHFPAPQLVHSLFEQCGIDRGPGATQPFGQRPQFDAATKCFVQFFPLGFAHFHRSQRQNRPVRDLLVMSAQRVQNRQRRAMHLSPDSPRHLPLRAPAVHDQPPGSADNLLAFGVADR
jgi:hypothetical protein